MSRSIHRTRHQLWRESRYEYSDAEERERRLEQIAEGLREKRFLKRDTMRQRKRQLPSTPVSPETIPVNVVDHGPFIHYPASPTDILNVMKRLPVGAIDGLHSVSLCLGAGEQEDDLLAVLLLNTGRLEEALGVVDRAFRRFPTWPNRTDLKPLLLRVVRYEAAYRLGRPHEGGQLPSSATNILRRCGFETWMDRCASLDSSAATRIVLR